MLSPELVEGSKHCHHKDNLWVLQPLAEVYPEARLRTKGQAQHEGYYTKSLID
jgi:hypothetical protein